MMRASIILNILALYGFAWLIWMTFFAPRPGVEGSTGLDIHSVDASAHFGIMFLIPALLLLMGVAMQIMSITGGAK